MVQKTKINVKERYSDGEVDLSMSDLDEVPVKEIAAGKKTVSLDLSNNRLTYLPNNFTILTSLTKLDLSRNELTELPEDFGSLSKLKYLDLYRNKLEHLPLSFGKLNGLKFLDLKDNLLVPAIAKIAGPCIDTKGCQQCARDIVNFFRKLQEEVDNEVEMRNKARQKQLELNKQKKQEEKKKQKKEKQNNKVKKEVQKDVKNTTQKISKKEHKKNKNSLKNKHKSFPIFAFLFFIFMINFLILWVLISIKHPLTELVSNAIKDCFNVLINKLPPDYKHYGELCGESVKVWQEYTKNVTLEAAAFVNGNNVIQDILQKGKQSYNTLLQKLTGNE